MIGASVVLDGNDRTCVSKWIGLIILGVSDISAESGKYSFRIQLASFCTVD